MARQSHTKLGIRSSALVAAPVAVVTALAATAVSMACGGSSASPSESTSTRGAPDAALHDPTGSSALDAAGAAEPHADASVLTHHGLDASVNPVGTAEPAPSATSVASAATPSTLASTTASTTASSPPVTSLAPSSTSQAPPQPSVDWSVLQAPAGCEVQTGVNSDADLCALTLTCGGLPSVLIHCTTDGCSCQDFGQSWPVQVSGNSLVDLCQASLDFCQFPTQEELDDTACTPVYGSAESSACASGQTCTRAHEYASGVTAQIELYESVECSFDPGSTAGQRGLWQCLCIRQAGSYGTVFMPEQAATLDTCTQASDLCLASHLLQPAAGSSCENVFETFDAQSCSSAATCLIARGTGNELAYFSSGLNVTCVPEGDLNLTCTVDGPLGVSSVVVATPTPALDACRDLAAQVLAELDALANPVAPLLDAGVPSAWDAGLPTVDAALRDGANGD